MSIVLKKYGAVSEEQIAQMEEQLGYSLPSEYRAFVREHDGAVPEENVFQDDVSIDQFIPVADLATRTHGIDGFPADAIAVAECPSGNFVYIKKGTDEVFFWDHEIEIDKKLASSFGVFLQELRPFDINEVQLKPGQVKSVWVDPDFKPEF